MLFSHQIFVENNYEVFSFHMAIIIAGIADVNGNRLLL